MSRPSSDDEAAEKRQKELAKASVKFSQLGCDFQTLKTHELEEIADDLNLDIGAYRGKKPLKADYLYAVERYFAEERKNANKMPVEYLRPNFNFGNRTKAYMRQIFAQHGMKYTEGEYSRPIADLASADLQKLFADKIDDMRAEAGYKVPNRHNPAMDNVTGRMDTMFAVSGDTPPASELRNSPQHNPFKPAHFPSASNGQQYQASGPSAINAFSFSGFRPAAAPPAPADPIHSQSGSNSTPGFTRYTGAIFGKSWNPLGKATPTTAPAASASSSDTPGAGSAFSAYRNNTSTFTTAGGGTAPVPAEALLSRRKIEKLCEGVEKASLVILTALHNHSVNDALTALDMLKDLLEDELPSAPAIQSRPASETATTSWLGARKLAKLESEVQKTGVAVQQRLYDNQLTKAISELDGLQEILELEL